jgi:hypothetical protein
MSIYNEIKPTWLIIKRHKVTGLLYFCKTSRSDPIKYKGSGLYWKRHLRVHGNEVDTIWTSLFTNKDDLVDFATHFSEFYNIVSEKNSKGTKIWANLELENGLDGMPTGTDRGIEFKEKSKINNAGDKNPSYGKYWWTNSQEEIKSVKCPDGWTRGRSLATIRKTSCTKTTNKSSSGNKNPRYDHAIYQWHNTDTNEVIHTTRFDFRTSLLIDKSVVRELINGDRLSYHGWTIVR